MATSGDSEWMLAAGRGDRDAFARVVECHQRAVASFIGRYLMTADAATVEDLTQDVFISAWQAADRYQPRAQVISWLLRIARNACLNHQRSQRLRRHDPLDELPEPAGAGGDEPEQVAVRSEREGAVRRALACLTPEQRQAVILRYYEQLPSAEIGAVMGLRPNAVDALLHRARRVLKRILNDEGEAAGGPATSGARPADRRGDQPC